jgi:hypothetical protein
MKFEPSAARPCRAERARRVWEPLRGLPSMLGFSLLGVVVLSGGVARARDVAPRPNDAADDGSGDPDGMAPPFTEGNIDYDVTYDDSVAQSYDDGYDPDAYVQFDGTLGPHGTWIDDDVYGRIWQPSAEEVGDDFSPYATGGRWALTEYGWTWNSDWAWGWAPFHYGRWLALADRGWCWMPGTLWGPAWVSWRAGGGYVGWAPLPPRNLSVGSPLGARSAWRFATVAGLGHGRTSPLPAQVVPGIFGRMTVVSNPRALPIPGARVRVNAGPSFAGSPPAAGVPRPARLAVVAPHALPQRTIEPHPGTPAGARPWIRASLRLPDVAAGRRGIGPELRPALGRGPTPPRSFPVPALPANRRSPMIHAAPTTMGGARTAPGYRGPIYRAPPVVRASPALAPRPWGGSPTHPAAPSYSRSTLGGAGSFSGGHSFGGGGSSSGGARSFGASGGRAFGGGGGHSFGGGRHR